MKPLSFSTRPRLLLVGAVCLVAGCSSSSSERGEPSSTGGSPPGSGGGNSSVGVGTGGSPTPPSGGTGGNASGNGGSDAAGDASAGTGGIRINGSGGMSGVSGGTAATHDAGTTGAGSVNDAARPIAVDAGRSEAAGRAPDAGNISGCNLPAAVGFQRDVQTFLITQCGGGSGCHVIDSASTTASGGFNHAYDWITGGAHPSSCPQKPTPMRFEIVVATLNAADPPTCSAARQMPPQNETGANLRVPLTTCQVAALQSWLNEPLITQTHRADDTSPITPYAMPPFN
jgi:hypothetical protein